MNVEQGRRPRTAPAEAGRQGVASAAGAAGPIAAGTSAPAAGGALPAGPGTRDTAGAARIEVAFDGAAALGRIALIPYIVAGYPDYETSEAVALAAIDNGADVLEIGLPYSDPLADGTTLQRASSVALRGGATFARSLALVGRVHAARPGANGSFHVTRTV